MNLSPAKLAKLLKKYAIHPLKARPGPGRPPVNGYKREALVTVFERYLDPVSLVPENASYPEQPEQNSGPNTQNPNTATEMVPAVPAVPAFQDQENTAENTDCNSLDEPLMDADKGTAGQVVTAPNGDKPRTFAFERIDRPPLVINLDDTEPDA